MNSQNSVPRPHIKEYGLVESFRSAAEVGGKSGSTDVLQDRQVDVLTAGEEEGRHGLVLQDEAGVNHLLLDLLFFGENKIRVYLNFTDVGAFCGFIGNVRFFFFRQKFFLAGCICFVFWQGKV